jgi:hypothetical protein
MQSLSRAGKIGRVFAAILCGGALALAGYVGQCPPGRLTCHLRVG